MTVRKLATVAGRGGPGVKSSATDLLSPLGYSTVSRVSATADVQPSVAIAGLTVPGIAWQSVNSSLFSWTGSLLTRTSVGIPSTMMEAVRAGLVGAQEHPASPILPEKASESQLDAVRLGLFIFALRGRHTGSEAE